MTRDSPRCELKRTASFPRLQRRAASCQGPEWYARCTPGTCCSIVSHPFFNSHVCNRYPFDSQKLANTVLKNLLLVSEVAQVVLHIQQVVLEELQGIRALELGTGLLQLHSCEYVGGSQ